MRSLAEETTIDCRTREIESHPRLRVLQEEGQDLYGDFEEAQRAYNRFLTMRLQGVVLTDAQRQEWDTIREILENLKKSIEAQRQEWAQNLNSL